MAIDTQEPCVVASDDEVLGWILAATLRGGGLKVFQARGAAECVKLAISAQPKVIILGLAREDAAQVCETLKSGPLTKRVPVVVLGRRDQPELSTRVRRAGAADFIPLPLSPLALWRSVDRLMVP